MIRYAEILMAIPLILATSTATAEQSVACRNNPKIVAECFTVHGRVTAANGIPLRLWVIGTHRVLAPDDVPPSVLSLLDMGWKEGRPMSISVFGDYKVCPLEGDRPGWMRAVCIESASHLVATNWEDKIISHPSRRGSSH
jgi:hypothetical protein